ncbi:MAG: hypothetical protein C3F15_09440 [Holophagae bacterium]|nr:MAG: hypothetical protein C3F15_09440 [Holophagae bacterium]
MTEAAPGIPPPPPPPPPPCPPPGGLPSPPIPPPIHESSPRANTTRSPSFTGLIGQPSSKLTRQRI